jgi:hydrogenase accessory protein HypB
VLALNLVSSPGSGKTTLLVKTIEMLGDQPLAVIEGDQQTANDADRIRATGAPAVQVNTGKGCHLDGHMVGHAVEDLNLLPQSLLFIENVGNLVCPAGFDLGEDAKVAILSVTEGEDKPLKYPDMFTAARLAILNKIDLAPHCDVDLDLYEENLRRVNPGSRSCASPPEPARAWRPGSAGCAIIWPRKPGRSPPNEGHRPPARHDPRGGSGRRPPRPAPARSGGGGGVPRRRRPAPRR